MKVSPLPYNDSEELFENSFGITAEELCKISDAYMKRKFTEDIDLISSMGGPDTLLSKLRTSQGSGLSNRDTHSDRIKVFGTNMPDEIKLSTYCEICWETLKDFTLRVLILSGIVSIIIGATLDDHKEYAWIEGFAIIVAVIVVVNVTAVNDKQKQKKFKDLQEQNRSDKSVTRIRDEVWTSVHPRELLVGDIVKLETGVTIPADGILLVGSQVEVLEAAMTGENDNIKKLSYYDAVAFKNSAIENNPAILDLFEAEDRHHDIPSPVVLSGTNLAEGFGIMLVTATGKNSAEGKIMDFANQDSDITPLMKKLDNLAGTIGKFGLIAAVITVVAIFLRIIITNSIADDDDKDWNAQDFIKAFIIGITVLVVAIPEGLPLAVTISLAYSVKKMQKDNNLVRKMQACETMGGADMICSDKTGTLTQNKMTVSEFWAGGTPLSFEKHGGSFSLFQAEFLHLLKESIFTNSSAYIQNIRENGKDKVKEVGSKTEIAMLLLMLNLGHSDYTETRNNYFSRFHKIYPFSSKRKRSSVLVTLENGTKRLHVKGASEVVARNCSRMITSDGQTKLMTNEILSEIDAVIYSMTDKALRVIALAYKDISTIGDLDATDKNGFPLLEADGLTFLGLVGIRDPIRDEVPEAVRRCQRAGITVRMVTGDNKATARAIAKECFIISSDDHVVMEGKEFSEVTGGTVCKACLTSKCPCPRNKKDAKKLGVKVRKDIIANFEAFRGIIKNMAVLARSSPEDKYTLVTGLKQLGHVVAVTGDGTNDAPALKKADIGFAMGIAGTEMAKEAADIILMDDNFTSIVRAVVWGRNIYDNIRSFLQFQLTVNVVAVVLAMVGAITIEQSPLTSVQLLWVNLIMDSFASLALATDPPTNDHLLRKPHKRTDFIIQKTMWKHIFGQSVLQLGLLFSMTYAGEYFLPDFYSNFEQKGHVSIGRNYKYNGDKEYKDDYSDPDIGPSEHFTYIFNVFVLMQLFNEINARKLRDEVNVFKGIERNWLFIVIWIFTFIAQIFIVSFGSYPFGCSLHGLSFLQWLVCIAFSITTLIWRFVLIKIPSSYFPEAGQKENIGQLGEGVLSFRGSGFSKRLSMNLN